MGSDIEKWLKEDGEKVALLSVYPEHMELEEIKREIEETNLHFEVEYFKTIIHNGRYTHGHILNFRRSTQ